ncbi:MAG: acetyl-CoA carboxylase biotin carboxylase subunit [Actinobacteria bacterium]|nr:acetyl-CoA carboxylase biotin carboxylase subunit [Actinomycetota bacterium]
MFRKVLVANRGEIAVRVIRALKELGIKSVAIYSEADKDSLHVQLADEAVCIGPYPSAKSYLSMPSIISAAEITKAEAIHPGYGFLSENETFVEICEAHGITFIGPPTSVMKLMGNKAKAKNIMKELGVPVIPEIHFDMNNPEETLKDLKDEDFPLLIKAAYGGGGRGIRVARDKSQFLELAQKAALESEAAFGSSELYIERFFEYPRHIEFQVIADKFGNVKVFYERDCSLQRKNQKIIEETPYEDLDTGLRERIMSTIEGAIKKLGYYNAGTLEFLYDGSQLYFMEMNTRLQVEHPITEEIYDVDLVKAQILVAAGEKLPEWLMNAEKEGHAIEFRINAENPESGFSPSPGKIEKLHFPGGRGVRIDSHIYEGYTVPPYYDSLIAKIIVHAKTREEAIMKGISALSEFKIEGIKTNKDFLLRIIQTDDYWLKKVYTRYVEEVFLERENARQ